LVEDILPQVKLTKTEGNASCYEVAPVLAGFSRSFGSALRRVLLSSLPSAAITSVQIEGVQHEFQDIPNIKEDVPDIVQNLKKIRLRSYADRTVHIYLDACGEGRVAAGDIKAPGTIEIVNPEAHIATLDNEKARLALKMTVDTGRGFVEASAQTVEEQPIGVILLDAIYSPVLHVNYTIEHMRVQRLEKLDKILLEITTDGTISPDEALRQSAHILQQQLLVFANSSLRADIPKKQTGVPIARSVYHTSIEDLALSVRAVNALRRNGIHKVGQLLEMEGNDLALIRNFGVRSLQELGACLQSKGFLPGETRKGGEDS
jgi:DNA-directed RNA polymerase subunit alpha